MLLRPKVCSPQACHHWATYLLITKFIFSDCFLDVRITIMNHQLGCSSYVFLVTGVLIL
jgi:hypothetical protein